MYVVEVAPIGRGMHVETLSYFSSTQHDRGTLLSIPLRSRESVGVVLNTTEVSGMKTALRAATFKLRKLPPQKSRQRLSNELLKTIDAAALYHATTTGAVLFATLPKEIREGKIAFLTYAHEESQARHTPTPETYIFQANTEDRYTEYPRRIREAFANKTSVLLVVPTIEYGRQATEALSGGIAEHTVLLNGESGIRALRSAYTRLNDETHPVLIIATPQYAFVDRTDIGLTILEHTRSHGYVGNSRPYVDYQRALTKHSTLHKRDTIIADTLIRTEDEQRIREQSILPLSSHPRRIELPGKLSIIKMTDAPDGVNAFSLFSDKLIEHITTALKKKERVFLFSARRGLAPIVACVDCGFILRSPESGTPLSLHRHLRNGTEERWLICSVSGYRERARDICPECGSWRLKERGIGIQHVYDELKNLLPDASVTLFDHTTASTPKKAATLRDAFYAEKQNVLVGTALALPYLTKPLGLSAIVNADTLRAIPSWRGGEEALAILLRLRECTKSTVYVQTRADDTALFDKAARGSTQLFYDEELAARETYNYPPFAIFIHLAWQGTKAAAEEMRLEIEKQFAPYNVATYKVPNEQPHVSVQYALIRIPSKQWPQREIVDILRALPPSVRILINPDRIV